jgi:TBC1 domain family protein 5
MLGGEAEAPRSTFAKASEHSSLASDEKRRMRGSAGKGFLFGDDDGSLKGEAEGRPKRSSASKKKAVKKKSEEEDVDEEVIDLDDVANRRAVS